MARLVWNVHMLTMLSFEQKQRMRMETAPRLPGGNIMTCRTDPYNLTGIYSIIRYEYPEEDTTVKILSNGQRRYLDRSVSDGHTYELEVQASEWGS